MTVVVGTTTAAAFMDEPGRYASWLANAEAIKASVDGPVEYFAALQVDARGIAPFAPLIEQLEAVGGTYWTYSLDDGRTEVTTANRLRHLTMGQNVVTDRCAGDPAVTHLLFLAADLAPPADALTKLLEVAEFTGTPFVGGHVSTYGLDGPRRQADSEALGADLRMHMPTAAFVLLGREVFNRIRWRYDVDRGWSDDPALWHDANDLLDVDALVRHDCEGRHWPECIGPIEDRIADRSVAR